MQISIVIFSINLITSSFLIQKTTTPQPLRGGGAHQKAILFMDDRLRILDQEVAIEKNTCSMRQM
jgi:hypothetical protein